MRSVGLHLRVEHTLSEAALHAQTLGVRSFQCFITLHTSGVHFRPSNADIIYFAQLRQHFDAIFLHASYYINPASCKRTRHPLLDREVSLAARLKVPYLVVHPGVATGAEDINEGIDSLARVIDRVHGKQSAVTLVVENTANFNKAVGSSFENLQLLLERIDDPDRLRFCIDTAHAYAYGYDISQPSFHDTLLTHIDETIGIKRIALIHLNDTQEQLGSYKDRHCIIGEGLIGSSALQAFILHKRLINIPIILELPEVAPKEYQRIVHMIHDWHN